MEYVDGCSLDQLMGTEWLTLERVLRLIYQVGLALDSAHGLQIIHRDIKPSNILIDKSGQIKLADFGLAKTAHDSQNLSGSGDLIGTPRYMSPEQVLAVPEDVDARTDVYSLGAVMYEALTGRPPFDGPNVLAILRQVTDEQPRPIRELNPDVPEDVAAICMRAMAKDRDSRFATAGQFAEAIQGCLMRRLLGRPLPVGTKPDEMLSLMLPKRQSFRPKKRPRSHWIAVSVMTLLVAVGVAWIGMSTLQRDRTGSSAPPAHRSRDNDVPELDARELLIQAQKQLAATYEAREGTAVRERYKSILEDLTSILKRSPANSTARLLRARTFRRTGELLAAVDDLDEVLEREPTNLDAVRERLLAKYQLYVLYLGNLNEPLLRPREFDLLKADVALLKKSGDPVGQAMAETVAALSRHDYQEVSELLAQDLPVGLRREQTPDWCMLQSDAAFHAANQQWNAEMSAGDEEKPEIRRKRLELIHRATQSLRRGLEVDPGHVGLIFLRANSFQWLARWSAEEVEDPAVVMSRQRPAFERTFDHLRQVTLRQGCDTALARAVLLSNFDRNEPALDQITDALSCRPTVAYLHTLRAWLRIQSPTEGILSSEEADRILRDFQPVFETQPDEFNSYFVRALLSASLGRPDDARRDLKQCRRFAASDLLPASNGDFQNWYGLSQDNTSRFLNATISVLGYLPVPNDVRVRLSENLLNRLNDEAKLTEDNLPAEEVQSLKAWSHFRLAQAHAERQERPQVLQHLREALAARVPELTPEEVRNDGTLSFWNEDDEFKSLYAEFTPK
jgi:tetratricopeptide (TPR) repeat protein